MLHMFFANDSYIFCKENKAEASHIGRLLSMFEQASEKSIVFFSRNMDVGTKSRVNEVLRFAEAEEGSHYLATKLY